MSTTSPAFTAEACGVLARGKNSDLYLSNAFSSSTGLLIASNPPQLCWHGQLQGKKDDSDKIFVATRVRARWLPYEVSKRWPLNWNATSCAAITDAATIQTRTSLYHVRLL